MDKSDIDNNNVSILKEPSVIVLVTFILAVYLFALGISVGRFLF